jgi:hypothetical protein
MRVGISHHLVVTTSLLGVEVEYFTRMGQTDGDWKIWLDYDENPDLEGLRHPRLGWDLIGLARLLWAYVGVAETIYQNAKQDGSQVEPFHLEDGIRRWRESHETRTLILSVLRAAERPLTRRQIANLIGLSKHPRLNKLIEEMAEAGEIKRIEEPLRNGKAKFLYSDNKDTPE